MNDPESLRLLAAEDHEHPWRLWGTYLSERQWGTVREDYSADGDVWAAFPHDQARSRAYRWGEDGLLGLTDRQCRLCFAPALWNGRDPILKERLFGLSGPEGNHGEDVKELYYYLDATPTHSYCKALYKYPQAKYPYTRLLAENRARDRSQREFELLDTGLFDEDRYFDVFVEYAKAATDDILIRFTVVNRGPETSTLHLLPTLWFRNTWSWGPLDEESTTRPTIVAGDGGLIASHETLGRYRLLSDPALGPAELLFTENETNQQRLFQSPNRVPNVKDAFHAALIDGYREAVSSSQSGTKVALHYHFEMAPAQTVVLRLRLTASPGQQAIGGDFDTIFSTRITEADRFYAQRLEPQLDTEERHVARSAYAGLIWSEQFYKLVQPQWAAGDPGLPAPPAGHAVRNTGWAHLYACDVLSMPDKWEFPYFCAWDLAFHCVSLSRIDAPLAKRQLSLLLREWYMHRNGQLPAYEFAFSDVNPPVQSWAVWRIYRLSKDTGAPDRAFLETSFQKLLLNFTWWVNREDVDGNNLFSGGFLGLDNIGVFDRSKPLPTGGTLHQADGTAWMAFYSIHMLSMALELANENPAYEDMASKFLEHFAAISEAINSAGGVGLWDEQDGLYYDQLDVDGKATPLRVRSIVGFLPMLATTIIRADDVKRFTGFLRRARWEANHRPGGSRPLMQLHEGSESSLLTIPSRERLERLFARLFDENEFLSPFGIRSLSRFHDANPYVYYCNGDRYTVDYEPGEGLTGMFGGNSNWRGPVWFPLNFLILESLRVYHLFYGDDFKIDFPTGSGRQVTLGEAAHQLAIRLQSLFMPNAQARRPCHGDELRYAQNAAWKDLLLFNEYYHAETGRGCGASHQTGWTALIADLLNLKPHWVLLPTRTDHPA